MLDEITEFKFKLRLYLSIFGAAAASFFSALQISRGDNITGLISILGCTYFLIVIYLMIQKRIYLWKGRGFLFFIPITILNLIYLRPEFGIYWAYVGVISFFLVMELKEATAGVLVFLAGVFYLSYPNHTEYVLYRVYGTLTLVALFTFSFSYLNDRLHQRLNKIATYDPLTNALNRYTFNAAVEKELFSCQRYNTQATLLLLDVDHFKLINDTYGHQAGDKVLKELAQVIMQRIRATDQLFRYGGEEFALLLPQTSIETALTVAEELRKMVAQHDFNISRQVTFSGGLSQVNAQETLKSWVRHCDNALYQAKEQGRNCIVIEQGESQS
ncbi:GGDEF domain-containing protein [Litoribrevibacter albus]|uniref:diguanylate cyclase n=1 Tax=Litoribrevibacter albus TaxID=1473156 RepID=A0AA37W835_9GAMM|nr:GGDEF domain-containing protein [Litoribrevibacter albus]GLQ31091.1 hypothetical protein GCM10007876_15700 [Litoribrevibacter albus]